MTDALSAVTGVDPGAHGADDMPDDEELHAFDCLTAGDEKNVGTPQPRCLSMEPADAAGDRISLRQLGQHSTRWAVEAHRDGRRVGVLTFLTTDRGLYADVVEVDRAEQGAGVGMALTQAWLDLADQHRLDLYAGIVRNPVVEGKLLYRLGFRRIGQQQFVRPHGTQLTGDTATTALRLGNLPADVAKPLTHLARSDAERYERVMETACALHDAGVQLPEAVRCALDRA